MVPDGEGDMLSLGTAHEMPDRLVCPRPGTELERIVEFSVEFGGGLSAMCVPLIDCVCLFSARRWPPWPGAGSPASC